MTSLYRSSGVSNMVVPKDNTDKMALLAGLMVGTNVVQYLHAQNEDSKMFTPMNGLIVAVGGLGMMFLGRKL